MSDDAILEVTSLSASYQKYPVLHDMAFSLVRGRITVLLGANGSGKTTTLRALTGMVKTTGQIRFNGRSITGMPPEKVARLDIAHVPQGRGTMEHLSVEDNLWAGAYTVRDRQRARDAINQWFDVFPRLFERRNQQAGSLSGGEQQMLAIARAMVREPQLLLLDEPSLGLAPRITRDLFRQLGEINAERGTSMLIVEQNAQLALEIGSEAMVIESGELVLRGDADAVANDESLRRAYLGY